MNLVLETTINAPADTVWTLLAHEFADISRWSHTVTSSRALTHDEIPARFTVAAGAPVAGRETTTKAATLREIIVKYSEDERTLLFDTDGLPRVFTKGVDHQTVIELDGQTSMVRFDVTMEAHVPVRLLLPLLKKRMAHTFRIVQADLQRAAEARAMAQPID